MNEILWQRVEAALDERRNPLDERGLARDLEASPEMAAAVRRLVERLGRIAPRTALPVTRRARGSNRVLAVAAGVLFVAAVSWIRFALSRAEAEAPGPERVTTLSLVLERSAPVPALGARVSLEPRRVLEWTLEGDRP